MKFSVGRFFKSNTTAEPIQEAWALVFVSTDRDGGILVLDATDLYSEEGTGLLANGC